MNQTAVQWLSEKMIAKKYTIPEWNDMVKQALAMEKKQIIDSWIATDNELQRLAAEKYYNETYNKDL
tara:strand:- start:941 stop:1141 length:201 start_codon:yes stop_codon:yes gene_type:complete